MIDTLIIVAAIGAVACGIVYFWARSARIEAEEQARRELARRELRQSRLDDLIRKPSTTNVSSSTTTTYTSTPSRAVPVRDDSDELATAMLVNQMMNNMVQPVYIDASPTYVVQEVPVASTYSAPEPASVSRSSDYSYSSNDSYSSSSSWSSSDSSYSSDSGSSSFSSD